MLVKFHCLLFVSSPCAANKTIAAFEDIVLPAQSIIRVPADIFGVAADNIDVIVDQFELSCAKKHRVVISASSGKSFLWVINSSFEPVVLPSEMRLAVFELDARGDVDILVISSDTKNASDVACPSDDIFIIRMNKSLLPEKRQLVVWILFTHASVIDFAQNAHKCSVAPSHTCHVINTGSAHPIHQRP